MNRLEKSLVITNKLGLHARAATKLAQLCKKFDVKVTVSLDGSSADAASIMGLMLLAGGQGKTVTVVAEGQDSEQALASICQLFTDKFDEAE